MNTEKGFQEVQGKKLSNYFKAVISKKRNLDNLKDDLDNLMDEFAQGTILRFLLKAKKLGMNFWELNPKEKQRAIWAQKRAESRGKKRQSKYKNYYFKNQEHDEIICGSVAERDAEHWDPESDLDLIETWMEIAKFVGLSRREKKFLIIWREAFKGPKAPKIRDLAEEMGVTSKQASKVKSNVLKKLKKISNNIFILEKLYDGRRKGKPPGKVF